MIADARNLPAGIAAPTPTEIELEHTPAVVRLGKDLRLAADRMSDQEARYLVDTYYAVQHYRIALRAQQRALEEVNEPATLTIWLATQQETLEAQIKNALNRYVKRSITGRWALGVKGIGPVLAAGLLAHIDIHKALYAGNIYRFAGIDGTARWDKGQKRPWNADLKTLCWKIGESFVKISNHDDGFYGHIYQERKAIEEAKNAERAFREQAKAVLEHKKIGKQTKAFEHYAKGELPPAHIHAKAKRYAVKLFLSHWHRVRTREVKGIDAPIPYAIAQLGDTHNRFIEVPNWPF